MNHYVYRITDLTVNRHYIGVRTTKQEPQDDLGRVYFSSSKDRSFVEDQRRHPSRFKYKIIMRFGSREEAVAFEVRIHARLDIGRNPAFYNRARQTNTCFSTPGMVSVGGKLMTVEEYRSSGLTHHRKGWKIATDDSGQVFHARVDDPRFGDGTIWSVTKGRIRAIQADGTKTVVSKEDYYTGEYTCNNTGKVPAILPDGSRKLVDKKAFWEGGFKHVSHGLISAVEISTGKTCAVSVEEYASGKYQGVNKGRINGSSNPKAKNISLYDVEGNLRYVANGDFKKVCEDNSLPFSALRRSYALGGTPIFSTKKTASDAIRMGKEEFIGWCAKVAP